MTLERAEAPSLEQPLEGFPDAPSLRAQALSRAIGVSVTVASWLDRLGHADSEKTRRFLNPRLAELTRQYFALSVWPVLMPSTLESRVSSPLRFCCVCLFQVNSRIE